MKARFKFSGEAIVLHLPNGLMAVEGDYLIIPDTENCFVMSKEDVAKYFAISENTKQKKLGKVSVKHTERDSNLPACTDPGTPSGKILALYKLPNGNGLRPKYTREKISQLSGLLPRVAGRSLQVMCKIGVLEYEMGTKEYNITAKGISILSKYHA